MDHREKVAKELLEIESWCESLKKKAAKARKLIEGEGKPSPDNQRALQIREIALSSRRKSLRKKS